MASELTTKGLCVNTRFLAHSHTGVQRYTTSILKHLPDEVAPIAPAKYAGGVLGHLWEQAILPLRVNGRLLWNPTCTGPLLVPRQVTTVHDLSSLDHPEWFDAKYVAWHRLIVPRLLRRTKHIIAISEYTKQRTMAWAGVEAHKITVIPNGVDARFYPRAANEVTVARSALGLGDQPYVLSVATLEPRKNIARLVEAWTAARKHLPEGTLLVLAGGKGSASVFNSTLLDGVPPGVVFTGYVPDEHLPALYSGAEVFVYPSLYEGFGLPILEAMGAGTAVVTSTATSIPEVAGDAALLIDPHRTDDIARAIVEVMTDAQLRARLREKGTRRAEQFSWPRTAQRTWSVLQQVAHSQA